MSVNPAEVLRIMLREYAKLRDLELADDFDERCDELATFFDQEVDVPIPEPPTLEDQQ